MKDYKDYLNIWLQEINEEVRFWKNYMETQGGVYYSAFQTCVEKNKKFVLEDDLPDNPELEIQFIDVGSGPFSRCGIATEKVKLEGIAVDPLADIYTILKKKNGLENGIDLRMGFVEVLDKQFEKNTFDLVHMSNALDHSFDPVFGIYQLLHICKIGGKVILRHSENEGQRGNYQGLHQWNLSIHNKEDSFVIWNEEVRYDIRKMFAPYVDFVYYPETCEEEGWDYNKVIMTKKKDIEIPDNNYLKDIFDTVYRFCLHGICEDIMHEEVSQKGLEEKEIQKRIDNAKNLGKGYAEALKNQGITSVVIYGYGELGQNLYGLLEETEVEVVAVLDKKPRKYREVSTVLPENYQKNTSVSRIIVTVAKGFEEVKSYLESLGYTGDNIVYIMDFLTVE